MTGFPAGSKKRPAQKSSASSAPMTNRAVERASAAAGSAGSAGSISGDYDTGSTGTPGAGNPPGYYIDGASYATWLATGTRLGLSK